MDAKKKVVVQMLEGHRDEIQANVSDVKGMKAAYAVGGVAGLVAFIIPPAVFADMASLSSSLGTTGDDAATIAWIVLGVVASLLAFGLMLKMMGLLR